MIKRHREFLALMTILVIALGLAAADAHARPALTEADQPADVIRVIEPGDFVHVANCRRFSDMDLFTGGGRRFNQVKDPQGWVFLARDGHAVGGFTRVNCDWFNFGTRPVILGLWREQTG
jgi:hypothetical protein